MSSVELTRGDGTVTATWDSVPGATTYHVTYSTDFRKSWSLAALNHPNTESTTTITIQGADNNATYIVGVRARNTAGNSSWRNSPPASPYTPPQNPPESVQPPPPPPPARVSSVELTRGDGTVTATWDSVPGATTYHVTYSTDFRKSWSLAALNHPNTESTTTITIQGADNNATYIVGVRARNTAGNSSWRNSPPASPYTPPQNPPESVQPPPPPPPARVSSVELTRGDGTVTATWDSVPGATTYHVTYSTDFRKSWSLAALNHPNTESTTTITIQGADNNATYIVGVRARNTAGNSSWRNSPPASPYTPPQNPTLEASDPTATAATLTISHWSGPWWYQHNGLGATCNGANTQSVQVTGLQPGTTYTITAFGTANCHNAGAGASASISSGTNVNPLSSDTFTTLSTPDPTLRVTFVTDVDAMLTIGEWTAAWSYFDALDTNSACRTAPAGTTVVYLPQFSWGQISQYKASRSTGSDCKAQANVLATIDITAPTLTAIATSTSATLTFNNWPTQWWHKERHGSCQGPFTGTATINGLRWGTTYDYFVYSASGCHYSKSVSGVRITTSTPSLSIAPHNPDNHNGWNRISIGNWDAAWWIKETHTNALGCQRINPDGHKDVYESPSRAVYRMYRAYSADGCSPSNQMATVELRQILRPTLTAGNITTTGATLSMAHYIHHYGWWFVRQVGPTTGSCSSPIAVGSQHNLSNLSPGTVYTYKAYKYSICYEELDSVRFSTKTSLTASNITGTSATLTIGERSGNWWLKRTSPADGDCVAKSASTSTVNLASLTPGQQYTYKAYNNAACTLEMASASFTTPGLSANPLAWKTATLTLSGYSGNWWLKRTTPADTTCISKGTNDTHSLSSLTPGQSYTYTAYNDSSCTGVIAASSFTTPASAPALSTGNLTGSSAMLTLSNYSGNWWLKRTTPSDTTCKAKTSPTEDLTNLTPGQSYAYGAYSDSSCTAELDSEVFTTVALSTSTVAWKSATLTLTSHTGNWWLKRTAPTPGTCTSVGSTDTEELASLTPDQSYTYAAFSDSGCTTQLDTATFTTTGSAPSLTAGTITYNSATLTLANVTGNWWLKRTTPADTNCKAKTTSTEDLASLNASTDYTYAAYSDSSCTTQIDDVSFSTTAQPSLSVWDDNSNIIYASLSNWNQTWWVRVREPLGNSWSQCASASANSTYSLTYSGGLLRPATYTVRAYSDSSCNTLIAEKSHVA